MIKLPSKQLYQLQTPIEIIEISSDNTRNERRKLPQNGLPVLTPDAPCQNAFIWFQACDDDLPERFTDPRCDEFRAICSNGFEGEINLASALLHKPSRWPQCFPDGEDGDCSCTTEIVRRLPPQGAV